MRSRCVLSSTRSGARAGAEVSWRERSICDGCSVIRSSGDRTSPYRATPTRTSFQFRSRSIDRPHRTAIAARPPAAHPTPTHLVRVKILRIRLLFTTLTPDRHQLRLRAGVRAPIPACSIDPVGDVLGVSSPLRPSPRARPIPRLRCARTNEATKPSMSGPSRTPSLAAADRADAARRQARAGDPRSVRPQASAPSAATQREQPARRPRFGVACSFGTTDDSGGRFSLDGRSSKHWSPRAP